MRILILLVALVATLTSCEKKRPFQKTTAVMHGDTLVVDGPAIILNARVAGKKTNQGSRDNSMDYQRIKKYLEEEFKTNDTLLVVVASCEYLKFEPKYNVPESKASFAENFYFICSVDGNGEFAFTDNFKNIDLTSGVIPTKKGENVNPSPILEPSEVPAIEPLDNKMQELPKGTEYTKAEKEALYKREMEKSNQNK